MAAIQHAYSVPRREYLKTTSQRSAAHFVPVLNEVFQPRSVIELGCGTGPWLAKFGELGVDDVVGVDLPEAAAAGLLIPAERFVGADLVDPPAVGRQFDLVMSFEVAEHLPYESARRLVEYLTSLGPVVLFSAAVPLQGGERHLNEQYPEYWAQLFLERGYEPIDCLRDIFWGEREVSWFYAQNALVYGTAAARGQWPHLEPFHARTDPADLTRLHPLAGGLVALYREGFLDGRAAAAEGQRLHPAELAKSVGLTAEGAYRFGYLAGLEGAHRLVSMEENVYRLDLAGLPPRPIRPALHAAAGRVPSVLE